MQNRFDDSRLLDSFYIKSNMHAIDNYSVRLHASSLLGFKSLLKENM